MADLTITIQLIQQQAKAAIRDFAAEVKRSANEAAKAHDAAEKQRTESTRRESAAQTAEHRRTTQQMIAILKEAAASSVGAAEAIRRGWETQSKSVASSIQSNIINPLKQVSSAASALSAGIINPIQQASKSSATAITAGIINPAKQATSAATTLTAGIINSTKAQQKSDQDYVSAQMLKANAMAALENQQKRDFQASVRRAKAISDATRDHESSILNVARAYTFLRIASEAVQGIRSVWLAVASAIKDSRDYIQQLIDKSGEWREKMVEIQYMIPGITPAGMAATAQAIKVRPEQYHAGIQESFRQMGSAVPREGEPMGPGNRMSREEFTKFFNAAFPALVNRKGLTAAQSGQIIGAITQTAPVGWTAEQALTQTAKMAEAFVWAPGQTSQVMESSIRAMNEIIPKGKPEAQLRWTRMLSMLAERSPQDLRTYARRAEEAMTRMIAEAPEEEEKTGTSRMKTLGITPEMMADPEAFVRQIMKKADENLKKGMSEEVFFKTAFPGEQRERISMRTLSREIRAMTDVRLKNIMDKATGGQLVQEGLEAGRAGQIGERRAAMAGVERAELSRGEFYAPLEILNLQAKQQIIDNIQLEKYRGISDAVLRQGGAAFGQGTTAEQMLRAERGSMLTVRAEPFAENPRIQAIQEEIRQAKGYFTDILGWRLQHALDPAVIKSELGGQLTAEEQRRTQGYFERSVTMSTPEDLVGRLLVAVQELERASSNLNNAGGNLNNAGDKLNNAVGGGKPALVGPAPAIPMMGGAAPGAVRP